MRDEILFVPRLVRLFLSLSKGEEKDERTGFGFNNSLNKAKERRERHSLLLFLSEFPGAGKLR